MRRSPASFLAGYESPDVRRANPSHYWAHRQEGEQARYYWEEEPVSQAEYVAAGHEDLSV